MSAAMTEAHRDAKSSLLRRDELRERCTGDLDAECLYRKRCFEPEVQSLAAIVIELLDENEALKAAAVLRPPTPEGGAEGGR